MSRYAIIIPSKNRHPLIKFLDDYYYKFGQEDIDIIVVDGSPHENLNYQCGSIKYYWKPELSWTDRILFGAKSTDASVISVGADDDFFMLEGWRKCADFILSHDEYVCCRGRHFRLDVDDYSNSEKRAAIGDEHRLESDDIYHRVRLSFTPYRQYIFTVVKKECVVDLLEEYTITDEYREFEMFEEILTFYLALKGKAKRVDDIFHVITRTFLNETRVQSPVEITRKYNRFHDICEDILKRENVEDQRYFDLLLDVANQQIMYQFKVLLGVQDAKPRFRRIINLVHRYYRRIISVRNEIDPKTGDNLDVQKLNEVVGYLKENNFSSILDRMR